MLNFQAFVSAQQRWSANTFGRGSRFEGIMKHIRKELSEIEADPTDATEYADVIILVADLAWRQGITPHQLTKALQEKQLINFARVWNVAQDDQPCEHIEPVAVSAARIPKIYPGYYIKAGESGWLEVVGTYADIEDPTIEVIRYRSDRDDHVYECFGYNLMAVGRWDGKEKEIISIWKYTGEDEQDEQTTYHSDLRAKSLEAMKYLNEHSDLYVFDVTHQGNLPKSVQFVGGSFRITSKDGSLNRVWIQSAHSLINQADIFRAEKEASSIQLSPEAQDDLVRRLG